MAVKNEGRSWKVLLLALSGTIIIWVLSNATPLLFDIFLEGEISKTTAVSFSMGLYGVISGGLITILGEKIGFLGKEDFAKGQEIRSEVDGVGTGMLIETDEQKLRRELVQARRDGVDQDVVLEAYEKKQEEKELKKRQEEIEAKEKELREAIALLEAQKPKTNPEELVKDGAKPDTEQ